MAVGTLTEFKSLIEQGKFSRKYNYEFVITPPAGITYAGGSMKNLMLRCESVTLPGQNMSSTVDDIRLGPGREHIYNVTYGPINAVFLADDLLSEKAFFEDWQAMMFNTEKSFELGYYTDFVEDMTIKQLDGQGNAVYGVRLIDAFPKTVGPVELSSTDMEMSRITVEIVFYKWKRLII